MPIGYGRLIVGSQVISAAYRNYDYAPYGEATPKDWEPINERELEYHGGVYNGSGGTENFPATLIRYNSIILQQNLQQENARRNQVIRSLEHVVTRPSIE